MLPALWRIGAYARLEPSIPVRVLPKSCARCVIAESRSVAGPKPPAGSFQCCCDERPARVALDDQDAKVATAISANKRMLAVTADSGCEGSPAATNPCATKRVGGGWRLPWMRSRAISDQPAAPLLRARAPDDVGQLAGDRGGEDIGRLPSERACDSAHNRTCPFSMSRIGLGWLSCRSSSRLSRAGKRSLQPPRSTAASRPLPLGDAAAPDARTARMFGRRQPRIGHQLAINRRS